MDKGQIRKWRPFPLNHMINCFHLISKLKMSWKNGEMDAQSQGHTGGNSYGGKTLAGYHLLIHAIMWYNLKCQASCGHASEL